MSRIEDQHLEQLKERPKEEQIKTIRREYIDNTSWLSKGTIKGGADFVQDGFNSSHFPLELIQNADDEKSSAIRFELSDEEISIFDNGNGFDLDGVAAVCQQGRSPKRSKNQIGFMGIGFKSLFEVCDRVEVHSNGYHFAFDTGTAEDFDGLPKQFVPEVIQEPEDLLPYVPDDAADSNQYQTKIVGKVTDSTGVKTALEKDQLAPSIFLFLRNLNEIHIRGNISSTDFNRHLKGRTVTNPESVAIAADRYNSEEVHEPGRGPTQSKDAVETKIIESNGNAEKWALFRNTWKEIPREIPRPQFREQISEREMFVALPLDDSNQLTTPSSNEGSVRVSPVHSYLPIKQLSEVEIDFIIHADFDLDPTRARIKSDSEWNKRMAEHVRELVLLPVLQTVANHRAWKDDLHHLIPESVPSSDEIIRGLLSEMVQKAKFKKILTGNSGLFQPNDAAKVSAAVHALFTSEEVKSITQKQPVEPTQEAVLDRLGIRTEYQLVDLLKNESCGSVLLDHLQDSEPSTWFSELYYEFAKEAPENEKHQYKRAFAKDIILTQNGSLCQGRDSRRDDSWVPYLPPRDGFNGISETRAAELGSLQLVHMEALQFDGHDSTLVREFFEKYGAEEATALDVVAEEVKNRGEESFSRSDYKTTMGVIADGDAVEEEVRNWIKTIDWESHPIRASQALIGELQDEIDCESCQDWISSNWERLDDSEKESSLRFLKDHGKEIEKLANSITVRTTQGKWVRPEGLVLPEAYKPQYNFEELHEEYPDVFRRLGIGFVDSSFAEAGTSRVWKEFLGKLNVGDKVNHLVGKIGERYVARELGESYQQVDHGADFQSEDGLRFIEVKSTKESRHETITIKGAQLTRLIECEDSEANYLVYPVVDALDSPAIKPGKLTGTELLQSQKSADFDINNFS